MAQFFDSINNVRKNWSKYDTWEQEQADERARKEHLAKTLEIPEDKVELTKQRAEAVVRATEIMDARSEDNCENMEQLTGMATAGVSIALPFAHGPITTFLIKKFPKHAKKIEKASPIALIGSTLLSTIGIILWGNSKQKQASRIGRFQAKQNELKGLENFVVYTPEQLAKAKEIAKTIPDEKERNSLSKTISELKALGKDKKAYKQWLANKDPKELEKLKSVNLSPEQLQRANEDKELIVDTIKEINMKAEDYSENLENAFDTIGNFSWLAAIPLGIGINKILKALKVSTPKVRTIVATAVPVMTSLGISITGTMEQKKASRIGRHQARKDILKNPARLMAYSDEDMKKVENIKAKKQKQSFLQKLGSSFKFLGTYYKDKSEYNKYRKTTKKENDKLQKAFKQIEITDAQKIEAKNLQANVFRTFDEVDEMSQRYSEDIEAGTEIAKEVGSTVWSLGALLGSAWLGAAFMKGKIPITKIANKLTNWTFDAKSPLKKAINEVANVVNKQDKKTVQEFQRALVKGKLKTFLADPKNKAIADAIEPLLTELKTIGLAGTQAAAAEKKDLSKILAEMFDKHFKQTKMAKWTRNMLAEGTKAWAKTKAASNGLEIPKETQEQLHMNFNYKNYKTLINTGLVAGIPILGTMVAIPYAFNAWLTDIQKKSGKIGIMKAMENVDDPRVFANKQTIQEQPETQKQTNLLEKAKQQAK